MQKSNEEHANLALQTALLIEGCSYPTKEAGLKGTSELLMTSLIMVLHSQLIYESVLPS